MNHILQQLVHYLFSKQKVSSYNEFFNQKVIKFVLIHLTWILFFATIYWALDSWNTHHPDFAFKYFMPDLAKTSKKRLDAIKDDIEQTKPFFYHLYFSALTQTTVGYAGQVNDEGAAIPILYKNKVFQLINFIQLCTIFMTPVIALFWHPDSGEFLFWKNNKKKLK
jgi:hypothetical protein